MKSIYGATLQERVLQGILQIVIQTQKIRYEKLYKSNDQQLVQLFIEGESMALEVLIHRPQEPHLHFHLFVSAG